MRDESVASIRCSTEALQRILPRQIFLLSEAVNILATFSICKYYSLLCPVDMISILPVPTQS